MNNVSKSLLEAVRIIVGKMTGNFVICLRTIMAQSSMLMGELAVGDFVVVEVEVEKGREDFLQRQP